MRRIFPVAYLMKSVKTYLDNVEVRLEHPEGDGGR